MATRGRSGRITAADAGRARLQDLDALKEGGKVRAVGGRRRRRAASLDEGEAHLEVKHTFSLYIVFYREVEKILAVRNRNA